MCWPATSPRKRTAPRRKRRKAKTRSFQNPKSASQSNASCRPRIWVSENKSMNYLHSINFTLPPEEGKPIQRTSRNVVGESVEQATEKVRKAYPGCDVLQCLRLQEIHIP